MWLGGYGFTPAEIAQMTPDQIYFILCRPADMIKTSRKSDKLDILQQHASRDGSIKVRLKDGTYRTLGMSPGGESKVARLNREAKEQQGQLTKKSRRRKRDGN